MIGRRLTRTRALVALGLGLALLLIAAASVAARPSSTPVLPPISPERLVASTVRALAQDRPVSGRLAARLDLGLPSIPRQGPGAVASGAAGFLASLTGTHRLRLWSSPDGFRLSDLLPGSERAVYVSRDDAWAWDFDSFTAYHLGRLAHGHGSGPGIAGSALEVLDPLALARKALSAIAPSTRVTVAGTTRVAGRAAYVLRLEPRTERTLVGRVEVVIDAERRIPLRVAVVPRGRQAAAVSATFTSIGFEPIDPSVYRFTPPSGAKRIDLSSGFAGAEPGKGQGIRGSSREAYGGADHGPGAVRIFGHDWTTVVALRTPAVSSLRQAAGGFDPATFLPLSGPLLSVRLVDRGGHAWLLYGLVPQSALAAAARELP